MMGHDIVEVILGVRVYIRYPWQFIGSN